ncbi:hypothetical protein MM440_04290 [Arsenicicoccus piscis]|uniref:Uncharacterized protein n=1 Tax=Arsenicicoccus piscis TaxID=673954 RepID=A0ABQ6HKQ2_9MICO|nr:hypothetical protein [Arsenicicoccus piscis]MCH8627024.1 hypothetical protein [Arsenicicoccus piscis]GMA19046.1 hypothetical protein GCM10025862_10670 [Arsenicicoccus piscis]
MSYLIDEQQWTQAEAVVTEVDQHERRRARTFLVTVTATVAALVAASLLGVFAPRVWTSGGGGDDIVRAERDVVRLDAQLDNRGVFPIRVVGASSPMAGVGRGTVVSSAPIGAFGHGSVTLNYPIDCSAVPASVRQRTGGVGGVGMVADAEGRTLPVRVEVDRLGLRTTHDVSLDLPLIADLVAARCATGTGTGAASGS